MPINSVTALEYVDGDSSLLRELAALFVEDYPRLFRELGDAVGALDYPTVERVAHTLKGRLAFFGMEAERNLALALELKGKECKLDEAGRLLEDLNAAIVETIPEFRDLARESEK